MKRYIHYPRRHSLGDARRLFESFKIENPDLLESWRKAESGEHLQERRRLNADGVDPRLEFVFKRAWEFIQEITEPDGSSAIIALSSDFRALMQMEMGTFSPSEKYLWPFEEKGGE
jgi:hypothetical protein